ncbi:MAG: hypothetical protein IT292_10755 [Deltaproteobacteria bacterium]|nr:hypothetical protein [Deltaproteobacteria bacterium]
MRHRNLSIAVLASFIFLLSCGGTSGDDSTKQCAITPCHGLDIQCTELDEPQMCTEEYQLGDNCRQFATCQKQNGICALSMSSQFTTCKVCVENCERNNTDDPMAAFTCEAGCLNN